MLEVRWIIFRPYSTQGYSINRIRISTRKSEATARRYSCFTLGAISLDVLCRQRQLELGGSRERVMGIEAYEKCFRAWCAVEDGETV